MKTGVWIEGATKHPAARVILFSYVYGWDARDADYPGVDIARVATQELFDDERVTEEMKDLLAFRWAIDAEEWLNRQVAPPGYLFGWKAGVFWFQTDAWWEQHKGPDRMWLP